MQWIRAFPLVLGSRRKGFGGNRDCITVVGVSCGVRSRPVLWPFNVFDKVSNGLWVLGLLPALVLLDTSKSGLR